MANRFIDGVTKICSEWLNAVDWAVFDALGQPKTPQDVRINIGAQPEAPADASVGVSGGWYAFPPREGVTGEVLVKNSDIDYDIVWGTPLYLPEGGVADQVLTKNSGAYADASWREVPHSLPQGGTDGQILTKVGTSDYVCQWEALPVALASLSITDVPPATPQLGELWFESDTGRTFVWYNDGTSTQWVLQSDPGVLAQGGGGDAGVVEAPIDGTGYVRRDAGWYSEAIPTDAPTALQYARVNGAWERTDHGNLAGLADDDHTQYYNQARGDARYSLLSHTHAYLELIGGALTGDLFLAGPPTTDLMAATKAYVDAKATQIPSAFPAGTVMLFQQEAAPTGWTKLATHNNKALRVVTGTVGSGGSVPFTTLFGRTATDTHTLTSSQIPSHTHTFSATSSTSGNHYHNVFTYDYVSPNGSVAPFTGNSITYQSKATDAAGAHSHTVSGTTGSAGSGGSHSHNIDMRLQYVDVILASKD